MKRRNFLTHITAMMGGLVATSAMAKMNNQHLSGMNCEANSEDCTTGGMHGKMAHDMHGDKSMASMGSMAHEKTQRLLSTSSLPKGKDLPNFTQLKNTSNKSGYFEATIHAKPVKIKLTSEIDCQFWAYNDLTPGPLIDLFEGDSIEIKVVNELPQATTVHWHGLIIPSDQDGNPEDEIKVGDSRIYHYTIPEGTSGTYWYHPHGHKTAAEQVFRGLAAPLIVRSKKDPLGDLPEQSWFFSDLKLTDKGQIADDTRLDWMNGREGQFVLINGAYRPKITIDKATRVRIWNACSGRYLNFSLPDCDIYLVATDGGYLEEARKLDGPLLLTPAERAEVVIIPYTTGKTYLESLSYDRSKMGGAPPDQDMILAEVMLTKSQPVDLPKPLKKITDIGEATAKKSLEYSEKMDMNEPHCGMLFLINGKVHDMSRIDLESRLHEVEEWTIYNNTDMDHNFHIHGTQFVLLSREYKGKTKKAEFVALKDTINIRPQETIKIKIQQNLPGLRMYHCHIMEHESLGMMGQLMVK